jgi:DNA-binding transcriptional LysR family regulator
MCAFPVPIRGKAWLQLWQLPLRNNRRALWRAVAGMDRLQTMRVFATVVDEGGFAAAARALDLSAAGVTRMVADLEEHLGVRLLQRTTRRLALTDAGQAYLERVRHILTDVDEASAVAQRHSQAMSGVLRLLAPPVLAVHILAPLVGEFRSREPGITLDIHVGSPAGLQLESFDLCLMGTADDYNGNVIARSIVSTDAVLCAAPAYLRRRGTPAEPAELAAHECLRLKTPGRSPALWQLTHPERDPVQVEYAPAFVCDHSDTLLRATLDGAGLSSQPVDLIAPYLKSGQLVRVLAPWITGRFTLYAALPSRKFLPTRTRVFLDFLTERTRLTVREALAAIPDRAG